MTVSTPNRTYPPAVAAGALTAIFIAVCASVPLCYLVTGDLAVSAPAGPAALFTATAVPWWTAIALVAGIASAVAAQIRDRTMAVAVGVVAVAHTVIVGVCAYVLIQPAVSLAVA
ncbi:hypothetical protein [Gordonia soli]|uniref:Uncharacterized protein n=1 Tax=Gordonia soli NBRC 108243 TaxID=1223545 RepID=M0QHW5_9ACTN|nr:hypothetical protein [Gordonia soli]GAC68230.1 hypothetical protein GS4_14_00610 [Gordonia soli NBRC 108243]